MINLNNFIIENNNVVTHENIMQSSCVEENFILSTLNFLTETNNEYVNCKKKLYRCITECENETVLNESFSDFFKDIKKIIDKFLDFIKSLFDRFVTALHRFVLSDKYLKKHKKDFMNFDSDCEFDFKGYNFTFDSEIPVIDAKAAFNKEFVQMDFDKLLESSKSEQDMINAISTQRSKIVGYLKSTFYDKFRGEVIGSKDPILTEDYSNELFRVYRDGEDSTSSITVTKDKVMEDLSFIFDYEKILKSVKQTKKTIEDEYNHIKKQISKMIYKNQDNDLAGALSVSDDYDGSSAKVYKVSDKVMAQVNLLINVKITQVETMTNIHALAFSSKIDAVNACFKQDKQVLYTALQKIQKNHKGGN